MRQLAYPVLIYTEKFIHGQVFSKRNLCERTIESFKRKIYDEMIVIDAHGYKYKTLRYDRKLHLNSIAMNIFDAIQSLFLRKFDDYVTWIDFELSEPEQITFEEAKAEILALVKKHPRWFKKSNENFKTIEEKLASYKSLQDMIEKLAGYP